MTTEPFVCPEADFHGKPFRYCGVKGCGWMESPPVPTRIAVVKPANGRVLVQPLPAEVLDALFESPAKFGIGEVVSDPVLAGQVVLYEPFEARSVMVAGEQMVLVDPRGLLAFVELD